MTKYIRYQSASGVSYGTLEGETVRREDMQVEFGRPSGLQVEALGLLPAANRRAAPQFTPCGGNREIHRPVLTLRIVIIIHTDPGREPLGGLREMNTQVADRMGAQPVLKPAAADAQRRLHH